VLDAITREQMVMELQRGMELHRIWDETRKSVVFIGSLDERRIAMLVAFLQRASWIGCLQSMWMHGDAVSSERLVVEGCVGAVQRTGERAAWVKTRPKHDPQLTVGSLAHRCTRECARQRVDRCLVAGSTARRPGR
jgi:hypothetical protein